MVWTFYRSHRLILICILCRFSNTRFGLCNIIMLNFSSDIFCRRVWMVERLAGIYALCSYFLEVEAAVVVEVAQICIYFDNLLVVILKRTSFFAHNDGFSTFLSIHMPTRRLNLLIIRNTSWISISQFCRVNGCFYELMLTNIVQIFVNIPLHLIIIMKVLVPLEYFRRTRWIFWRFIIRYKTSCAATIFPNIVLNLLIFKRQLRLGT